jgi:hypothetical protein
MLHGLQGQAAQLTRHGAIAADAEQLAIPPSATRSLM